ncbi:hypothetical protein OOT46_02530 [Aquabacterium sp. A7-Y]|uniref:hypothetical protein n=1 Tax=Aquabacterium sp. A7-Y TaxID=1349605 RepID=UPI00223DF927|nr:hypothetical protein [Aquabacterium sp. A7-Y]MCW7536730.1 hypothetical protein [Aquabacterium sp. A7-Y]
MKYHAYVGQRGYVRKSAYQVRRERLERYRGGPSPEKFFTLHPEGHRKPLEHVIGPGRPHFRFKDGADEGGPGGPGESLEHLLFKEAVASITRTRLSLGKYGDHRIVVSHGETEKEIPHARGPYRADVYLRFEAEEPSELGLKWAGEVYIEIHKAHLVDPVKHDEIRRLGIPMIEVSIHPRLMYRHAGSSTTDELEEDYRQGIKRMLEAESGFLQAVVLSNPSSAAYLLKRLGEVQHALEEEQKKLVQANSDLITFKAAERRHSAQIDEMEKQVSLLNIELDDVNNRATESSDKATQLTEDLEIAQGTIADLRDTLRQYQIALGISGAAAVAIALMWAI